MSRQRRTLRPVRPESRGENRPIVQRPVLRMEKFAELPRADAVFFDGKDENGTTYHCFRCDRVLALNIPYNAVYESVALACPGCDALNEWPHGD